MVKPVGGKKVTTQPKVVITKADAAAGAAAAIASTSKSVVVAAGSSGFSGKRGRPKADPANKAVVVESGKRKGQAPSEKQTGINLFSIKIYFDKELLFIFTK